MRAFERALAIDEAALGRDHPSVARDANNLAGVLKDMGDGFSAREALDWALSIYYEDAWSRIIRRPGRWRATAPGWVEAGR